MRVGKKPKVVESKQTRSCVVRLEKVRVPIAKKGIVKKTSGQVAAIARAAKAAKKIASLQDDRKNNGPLKKRPVAQTSPTPSPKPRDKTLVVAKPQKLLASSKLLIPTKAAVTSKASTQDQWSVTPNPPATPKQPATPKVIATPEETPTIAAGRSRRAIKPNPKYSSGDMVTPKMMRHVAAAAGRQDSSTLENKKRKLSTSSSEDFYNKDSSDADFEELNDEKDDDTDFSDIELEVVVKPRGRGRPPRSSLNAGAQNISAAAMKKISQKGPSNLSSRLQQLRKTIVTANTKRLDVSNNQNHYPLQAAEAAAKKRKLHESGNDSDCDIGSKRRKVYPVPYSGKDTASLSSSYSPNHKALMARKGLPTNTTLNGSKVTHGLNVKPNLVQAEKRNALLEKALMNRSMGKTFSVKSSQSPSEHPKSAVQTMKSAMIRQRTSSPARVTQKNTNTDKVPSKPNKTVESSSPTTGDDFEIMPTFTIVNINDIINKKGDVLISKSNAMSRSSHNKSPSREFDSDLSDLGGISEDEDEMDERTERADRVYQNHRKFGSSKLHTEKLIAARDRNSPKPASTSTVKRSSQNVFNHTISNKNFSKSNQRDKRSARLSNVAKMAHTLNKQAPRILNAMVAKKTLPVKPLIANLDDSADESFMRHSLDDEDIDDDDEMEEDPVLFGNKRRTTYPVKKVSQGRKAKENSVAALKREMMPAVNSRKAPEMHKASPEKVVISRQGDKIIKKITCFETWHIINLPEDRPAEVVRNQLDLPLIKLANAAKSVDLPSVDWNTKVTLYQLSPTSLSKSSFVTYTGDLKEQNIPEEDRYKYQPSCVMFRRTVSDRSRCRLPYDRAVIFKNKTFFTNIEGKNVRLVAAPNKISTVAEVEILLQLVDDLSLKSSFVEQTAVV